MAAYLIAELIEVNDADGLARYAREVGPTLDRFRGTTLAYGPATTLEGLESPQRAGVFRFDSLERLRAWYDSPEYAPLKELRNQSATYNLYVVEGP